MVLLIIGLTGSLCAGKGTVAEFLKDKGFKYYSLSDMLREELDSLGIERTRANLIAKGNELRETYGAGALARKFLVKIKNEEANFIIDGIRNPAEAEELKKKEDFFLVAVDAPLAERFKRMQKRKRGENDPKTIPEFKELDELDKGKGQREDGQQVGKTMKMADAVLINNVPVKELMVKVNRLFSDLSKRQNNYKRPSWDEYFMEVTKSIAKRATCDRGRSGCVIAKNKQILVTGYVGSPIGLPHCDEVGHQMKKMMHEDGKVTQHCVRTVHAEQNAICQAAKLGTSLDGATLYCKMTPCRVCAMLIINAGIKAVVCEKKYHAGAESEEMFRKAGISLHYFIEEVEQYKNQ